MVLVGGMDGSLSSANSSRGEDAVMSSGDEGRSGGSRYSPEDTQRKLKKGADTVRHSRLAPPPPHSQCDACRARCLRDAVRA